MRCRLSALCFAAALLVAGCSSGLLRPYRMDVRQGNLVTQEMVDQLRPGMTREQVRFLLGSPMVTDMFHSGRWDYIYQYRRGRGEMEQRRLTVFFRNDRLDFVSGDVVARAEMKSDDAPAAAGGKPQAGTSGEGSSEAAK